MTGKMLRTVLVFLAASLSCALVVFLISGCVTASRMNATAMPASPEYHGALELAPIPITGQGSQFGQFPTTGVPGSIGNQPGAASPGLENFVPPESLPRRSEELWVIEKTSPQTQTHQAQDEIPGSGTLLAKEAGDKFVPVPLKHTDVKAHVEGYIASVDVTQQYQNPYNEKIEAVYVFPLPDNAAISEFVMTIGERRIRGIIRERKEAEEIYRQARSQGYVASLLTQERPNIFTQAVANIEPGKKIDIDIRYYNTLEYVDGWYEFVFPMVVGPRFNPPGTTQGVGAVARNARGRSGQSTEVQYLRPDERNGHDISLAVDLDAGVAIEGLDSRNHKISVKQEGARHAQISLDPSDSIPNRDFVLRYKVAGDDVKSGLIVHRDRSGSGYFSLMLFPPADLTRLPRKPLEMVFTIDVSGSQSGKPLEQEKAATRYCLTHMDSGDTFQVVRFGDTAQRLFPRPMPAEPVRVRQALQWVDGFDAREGTMLVDGVRASLLYPSDPSRLRFVAFMTDGFIGNESEALAEIHNDLGPARIFSFGVGSSTNRYLLDHMAKMRNGAAAYLGLNDDASEIMAAYFARISRPALTDIHVDFGAAAVDQVFPVRIPDLFVGRPVLLTGKLSGPLPKVIKVSGAVGGETRAFALPVTDESEPSDHPALAALWARQKLADLGDRATYEKGHDLPQEIRQIALQYGLLSDATAFVAVDSLTRTSGDHGTSVAVPVPVPEGLKYETNVQQ